MSGTGKGKGQSSASKSGTADRQIANYLFGVTTTLWQQCSRSSTHTHPTPTLWRCELSRKTRTGASQGGKGRGTENEANRIAEYSKGGAGHTVHRRWTSASASALLIGELSDFLRSRSSRTSESDSAQRRIEYGGNRSSSTVLAWT